MVEWKKLGEVCNVYDGTHQTPKYTDCGIKFVSVENIHAPYNSNKYISEDDYIKKYKTKPQQGDVLMTRIGDIGTCTVLNREEPIAYYVSLALLRPNQDLVQSNYVKYILESNTGKKELRKKTLLTAVPLKINLGDVGKISIPIPSLSEQQRIVSILDTFTSSISNLKQQIEERRKQYEYERDLLLDLEGKEGVEMKKLGDFAEIGTGSSNTQDELESGRYPFFVRSQIVRWQDDYEFDEIAIITSGDGVGVGKVLHYYEGKYALHQRAYRIHVENDSIVPKFIFYFMQKDFYWYIMSNAYAASVTSVRRPMLINYPIPIPPLSIQSRIVSILDTFEQSISNLEEQLAMREKQYEYYRNQLLTFEGEEERGKT